MLMKREAYRDNACPEVHVKQGIALLSSPVTPPLIQFRISLSVCLLLSWTWSLWTPYMFKND